MLSPNDNPHPLDPPHLLAAHDYSITIEDRELQPRHVNNKVIKGGRHGNYKSTCCLGNHYPTSMETTSLPAALETTTRLPWKLPVYLLSWKPLPDFHGNYQFTYCLGNHYPTSMETTSLPAVMETTTRLPWKLPQSTCCLGNHYPTSRTVRLDPLSLRTPPLTPNRPHAADTAAEGWTLSGDGHQGLSTDVVGACPTHHLGCQGVSNTPPRLSGRLQHTTSAVRACPTHHLGCQGVSHTPPRLSGRVQHTTEAVRACHTHHRGCQSVSNTPPRPRSVLPRQQVATGNIRPLISRLTHNHNKQTNKQARETQADSAD